MSVETLPELKKRLQAGNAAAEALSEKIAANPPANASQLAAVTKEIDAVEESSTLSFKGIALTMAKIILGAVATAGLTALGVPHLAIPLVILPLLDKGVDAVADAISKPNSDSGYKTPTPLNTKPRLV